MYVKDIASGEMTHVTSDPAADHHPVWSPDGKRLAFLRWQGTGARVILVPAGGGLERELASISQLPRLYQRDLLVFWLDWSPDGRFLAVSDCGPDGQSWGFFLISVETGEKRGLSASGSPRIIDHLPAFSPDGRTLIFMRAFPPEAALLIQPLSSDMMPEGPARTLKGGATDFMPSWMPGGRELLLGRRIVPLDGSSSRPFRLPGVRGSGGVEQVSIRGTRLVYSTPEPRREMLRVSLSGVTRDAPASFLPSTRGETGPAFAPEGRRVAFCSSRSGDNHIWVCNVDGSGCRELPLARGSTYGCSPSWSPNGRQLAFDAAVNDKFHVFVAAPEGGTIRRLTPERTYDARPRWSRDGRSIYFTSTRSGDFQIWRMPVEAPAADAAVRITRNGGIEGEESPDGHLYFAKRNEPGLWRLPLADPAAVPEEKVLDVGGEGRWRLRSQGIFVLDDHQAGRPPTIWFFDLATRRASEVRALPPEWSFVEYAGAFAVSPDGRWGVVTRERIAESDLMLVEGFR